MISFKDRLILSNLFRLQIEEISKQISDIFIKLFKSSSEEAFHACHIQ